MSPELVFSLNLAGSIALLLWGSYMIRAAVEKAYSDKLGAFLASASDSKLKSFICGLGSALVLQSTTATVMLTASFVTSGLLTLGVAIVIILGADMGSAIAVRILFLELSILSPVLLFTGLCFHRFAQTWRRQQLGLILIGLGLMLLSIQLIKQTIAPYAVQPLPNEMLNLMDSAAWIALILAALATWLAHSSVSIILVIASMAEAGLMQPSLFFATLLGANIGSGIIALFLANRRHQETYGAVLANFLMRFGLAVILFLLSFFIVSHISLFGVSGGVQVINMHIAFNLVLALLFVPLNTYVARLSLWLINTRAPKNLTPDSHSPGSSLDPELVKKPKLALSCARREAFRLADNAEALYAKAMDMFEVSDRLVIEGFIESDKEISQRNRAIQRYLAEARRYIKSNGETENQDEQELNFILRFSTAMDNIGDIVSYNLARLATKRIDRGVVFSTAGFEELKSIHKNVTKLIQMEITAFASNGVTKQKQKMKLIGSIKQIGQDSLANHHQRLSERKPSSLGTSSIHVDAVRDMLQVVDYLSHLKFSQ